MKSDVVGSKYFCDGEAGCFCKDFDPLYPWLNMIKAGTTVALVEKTVNHAVTNKRKQKMVSCSSEETVSKKKRKTGA